MTATLNVQILIGKLGKDAETRTAGGSTVTAFTMATNHSYKGKDGKWVNNTDWHNVVVWAASEYLQKALHKGANVYVEGRTTTEEYKDKDGNMKRITKVIANKVTPLDRQEKSSQTDNQDSNDDMPF